MIKLKVGTNPPVKLEPGDCNNPPVKLCPKYQIMQMKGYWEDAIVLYYLTGHVDEDTGEKIIDDGVYELTDKFNWDTVIESAKEHKTIIAVIQSRTNDEILFVSDDYVPGSKLDSTDELSELLFTSIDSPDDYRHSELNSLSIQTVSISLQADSDEQRSPGTVLSFKSFPVVLKKDILNTVDASSDNPVSSSAIYEAIRNQVQTIEWRYSNNAGDLLDPETEEGTWRLVNQPDDLVKIIEEFSNATYPKLLLRAFSRNYNNPPECYVYAYAQPLSNINATIYVFSNIESFNDVLSQRITDMSMKYFAFIVGQNAFEEYYVRFVRKSNALFAPLDSPHFTGTPSAPTAEYDSDPLQIANKQYVDNQVMSIRYGDADIEYLEVDSEGNVSTNRTFIELINAGLQAIPVRFISNVYPGDDDPLTRSIRQFFITHYDISARPVYMDLQSTEDDELRAIRLTANGVQDIPTGKLKLYTLSSETLRIEANRDSEGEISCNVPFSEIADAIDNRKMVYMYLATDKDTYTTSQILYPIRDENFRRLGSIDFYGFNDIGQVIRVNVNSADYYQLIEGFVGGFTGYITVDEQEDGSLRRRSTSFTTDTLFQHMRAGNPFDYPGKATPNVIIEFNSIWDRTYYYNATLTVSDYETYAIFSVITDEWKVITVSYEADVAFPYVEYGYLPWSDIEVPTRTSELVNDSGFITRAVNDLANYYTKSTTYTKTEIDERISAIPKFSIKVVNSLPVTDISATTIYLVKTNDESQNLYTEYIYADDKWEKLGEQSVDLSGYVQKEPGKGLSSNDYTTEEKTKLAGFESADNYVLKEPGKGLSSNDYTAEEKTKLAGFESADNYVLKEDGKGLSSNDYTTEEKTKLAGFESADSYVLKEDGKGLSSNDYTTEEKTKLSEFDNADSYLKKTDIDVATNAEVKQMIEDIFGSGAQIQVRSLLVTENGIYEESGVAYSPVTVNVVGIVPTGTLLVSANGPYDVTEYAEVEVAVPSPSGDVTITENGTWDVTDYETANVSVKTWDNELAAILNGTATSLTGLPSSLTKIKPYAFYQRQAKIPEGFTQLESVHFDGREVLQTEIPYSKEYYITIDAKADGKRSASQVVFGYDRGANGGSYVAVMPNASVWSLGNSLDFSNAFVRTSILVRNSVASSMAIMATINGVTKSRSGGLQPGLNAIMIGGCVSTANVVSYPFVGDIYGEIKAKYNGEVEYNYVPVKRNSDNVVGFFETVHGVFVLPVGGGELTEGAEVPPVETESIVSADLSVTEIGAYAFFNNALSSLTLRANQIVTIADHALDGTSIASGTGRIYVPADLVSAYQADLAWSAYASSITAITS